MCGRERVKEEDLYIERRMLNVLILFDLTLCFCHIYARLFL